MTHWGILPGTEHNSLLRIPVSRDKNIPTIHKDEKATGNLEREKWDWFKKKCESLEVKGDDGRVFSPDGFNPPAQWGEW